MLINIHPLLGMIIRFFINLLVLTVIAGVMYYPKTKRKEFVFTYIMVGSTIFALSYLLSSINMELGLALGLFAVFGILRYRTVPVQTREMSYMVIIITISLINSLTSSGYQDYLVLVVNGTVIAVGLFLELVWMKTSAGKLSVRYDKIELIIPELRKELIEDLQNRLGIQILDVSIGEVDFLRDIAVVEIEFDSSKYPQFTQDGLRNNSPF